MKCLGKLAVVVVLNLSMSLHLLGGETTGVMNSLTLQDGLEMLSGSDSTNKAYAATFIARVSHYFAEDQGIEIENCEVWWTRDSCVMSIKSTYENAPEFRSTYRSINYDQGGNLIVWRPVRKYIVSTGERNDMREESDNYRISPEGNIISTNLYTEMSHFAVGDRNSIYLWWHQFRKATGRGFAHNLVHILSSKNDPSTGLNEIEAQGSYEKTMNGKWALTYDEKMEYLVRKAVFTVEGTDKPHIVVVNSGVAECPGLRIAASGTFALGRYQAQFQVLTLKSISSEDSVRSHYNEVVKHLDASLPPGHSGTVDYRGGIPKRTSN